MASATLVHPPPDKTAPHAVPRAEPCLLVIFGASGDLASRLLMPALYHLACDASLPEHFAIIGAGQRDWSTDELRSRMTAAVREFGLRQPFDEQVWARYALACTTCGVTSAILRRIASLAELMAEKRRIIIPAATSCSTWQRRRPSSGQLQFNSVKRDLRVATPAGADLSSRSHSART